MIDKHVRFTKNDSKSINLYALENSMSYAEAVRDLINIGINEVKRIEKENKTDKLMIKIVSEIEYLIKLLEQLYSDFGFDELTTPNLCETLNLFKYKCRRNMMDD